MKSGDSALSTIDRALGSTESIYWLLDRLYCLNFVVFAEVQGRLDPARLKAALATVQDEHPLLRARIERVGAATWFKPVSRQAAPLVAELRALTGWRREIERQLHQRFEPAQAPLARFLWFKGAEGKSVVAMTFQHAIGDGRSGMAVMLQVLRRATVDASPPSCRPARASSQALDLIQHKPPLLGALQGLKFWLGKGKDTLRFAQQLPGYDPKPRPERSVKMLPFVVAKRALAKLLAAARRHGTTLHGALGAALLLALSQQFEAASPRRLALNSLADLRGVLKGGLSDRDLGLYVTTLCTVHALGTRPDFWSLAREIRDALKQIIDSGDANLINAVYRPNPAFAPGESTARRVQAVVSLGPPSSMLTNLGRIDDVDLGSEVAVRSLAVVVSPPAQHPICVTATSHGGRMCMYLLYDEKKMSREQAKQIGDDLMAHLQASLGAPIRPRSGRGQAAIKSPRTRPAAGG